MVFTSSRGEAVNVTSEGHGGPAGSTNITLPGTEGTWELRIPTWRGGDGAFPAGRVRVEVTAP